jgi:hypothetical protein
LYHRRKTREIIVGDPNLGGFVMGGDHPVVKQSCPRYFTANLHCRN